MSDFTLRALTTDPDTGSLVAIGSDGDGNDISFVVPDDSTLPVQARGLAGIIRDAHISGFEAGKAVSPTVARLEVAGIDELVREMRAMTSKVEIVSTPTTVTRSEIIRNKQGQITDAVQVTENVA